MVLVALRNFKEAGQDLRQSPLLHHFAEARPLGRGKLVGRRCLDSVLGCVPKLRDPGAFALNLLITGSVLQQDVDCQRQEACAKSVTSQLKLDVSSSSQVLSRCEGSSYGTSYGHHGGVHSEGWSLGSFL